MALVGLCLGSFLNVCIYRVPNNQSIVYPPSCCMNCKTRIPPLYLIPILGYMLSKAKCFNCKAKISIQYPIIEILSSILAVGIYINSANPLDFITFYNLMMVLLAITVIDLKIMIIPDQFIIYLIISSLPFLIITGNFINILAGVGLGLFFYLIAVLSKGGMGGGDVKLAFVMGIYLGIGPGILSVFLAFLVGGITGVALLLGGENRKRPLPFAPYLVLGTVVAYLWGDQIINWYLRWVGIV